MEILVFNWRDIKNPNSGGAEVFTHEVLEQLVNRGHEATIFTSKFRNSPDKEVINGVEIVRSGGRFTVYHQAKKYYQRHFRGKYDVVIDEINTRPFMTPKYVDDGPILALIHQLAREFWFYEAPFPVNWLGYHWLEDRWLKRYIDIPTITVSESTKQDLMALGFKDVTIVPEGISMKPLENAPPQGKSPTFLFVGRMKEAKCPDHALDAFNHIQDYFPDAKLHMVGAGYMLDILRSKANGNVCFHGFVSEEEKLNLMKKSHVLLVPGVREGWGLVVTEANAMGTPAVGYNVPGLKDSIEDGKNGIICETNPQSMAKKAIELVESNRDYRDQALKHAKKFDWEKTADHVESRLFEIRNGV